MKKWLKILAAATVAAAVAVTSAIGCFASEEDDVFIVGFDAEFPPYGYKDDSGEYVGFDLDLAEEVCQRNSLSSGTPRIWS